MPHLCRGWIKGPAEQNTRMRSQRASEKSSMQCDSQNTCLVFSLQLIVKSKVPTFRQHILTSKEMRSHHKNINLASKCVTGTRDYTLAQLQN